MGDSSSAAAVRPYSRFAQPFLTRARNDAQRARAGAASSCSAEMSTCPAFDGSCAGTTPFCVSHGTFGCMCKDTPVGVSGHARYNFSSSSSSSSSSSGAAAGDGGALLFAAANFTTRWASMPARGFNAYAAVQLSWEGATGYAGTQFLADGTQLFDFAIWDSNGTSANSRPDGAPCARFGGEGTGAHCETPLPLVVGRDYGVALRQVSANASGVTWAAFLSGKEMGRLFWDEGKAGTRLGGIQADGFVSFHEYFTLQGFNSSVGFAGPVGVGADGSVHQPAHARCESDAHHNCLPCAPGLGCGPPNVLLEAGAGVPSTNGSSVPIW